MRRNGGKGILIGAIVGVIALAVILILILPDDTKDPLEPNDSEVTQGTGNNQNDTSDDTEGDTEGETEGETGGENEGEAEDEATGEGEGETEDEATGEGEGEAEDEETDDTTGNTDTADDIADKIVAMVKAQIGKTYAWGEEGPDAFDVSGLIYYCFTENGINVPRTVKELATHGEELSFEEMQPGDVVFFWSDTEGTPQYAGIYIGGGKFIAVKSSINSVEEINIGSYFTEHFLYARRYR